jgi:hypothetical protein
MSHPWQRLFAPLPDGELQHRTIPALGWKSLSLHLSAGEAGLRHVLVTLDEKGVPISASDHVLTCEDGRNLHESVGGRLEADGRFLGTRWRTVTREVEGQDDAEVLESVSSPPSEEDAQALRALVAEILRRAG